jgi:hypothetical protein
LAIPVWLQGPIGYAEKYIKAFSVACFVVKATVWRLHHQELVSRGKGPSVREAVEWAYECGGIHEVVTWVEELF